MFIVLARVALALPAPIVGGAPVVDGSWPDAAIVYAGETPVCSGVLVAPDLVLTAGHCASSDGVAVGTADAASAQRVAVAEVVTPVDAWLTYDVAALILAAPVTTAPRPLAVDCAVDAYVDGATVTLAGFGAHDADGEVQDWVLRAAETTLVDADCDDVALGCRASVMPGGELIAGGEGVDSCNGDSGGPLYLEVDGATLLAGTTSRAVTGADVTCGGGGIYVRADAIIDWLELATGRLVERPDCGAFNHPPRPTVEVGGPVWPGEARVLGLAANDPDLGDSHRWALVEGPSGGELELSDEGAATYVAWGDAAGVDGFEVLVTDDGEPPLSTALWVEVPLAEVVWPPTSPPERGGGCAGVVAPWGLALAALARRRRQGARVKVHVAVRSPPDAVAVSAPSGERA